MKEENSQQVGAAFVKELVELGDKYGIVINPAAAAQFYAQQLHGAILRELYKDSKWAAKVNKQ